MTIDSFLLRISERYPPPVIGLFGDFVQKGIDLIRGNYGYVCCKATLSTNVEVAALLVFNTSKGPSPDFEQSLRRVAEIAGLTLRIIPTLHGSLNGVEIVQNEIVQIRRLESDHSWTHGVVRHARKEIGFYDY